MTEKTVENNLARCVKEKGGLCLKFLSASMQGLPDRIVLLPCGKIFFVELKAPGKKPRPQQLRIHKKFKELGVKVYVVDSPAMAKEVIENEICTT